MNPQIKKEDMPIFLVHTDKDCIVIGVETWNRINGEWYHLCQFVEKGKLNFYTNGKLEK